MKKYIALITLTVTLTGCQLMGGDSPSLLNADFDSMSCADIKSLFDEYKDQMDNVSIVSDLASAFGVDSGTDEAKSLMREGYFQARDIAMPIMKLKQSTETI